jgi:glycine/D-amino acid oxidase-like deaminating enzyme
VRTAPNRDGPRLLIVTGEQFTPGASAVVERFERLVTWITERFPGAEVAYRWATQENSTTDHRPYVGLFHPGAKHVYVATGFGGWGMSTGVSAGKLLAGLIIGAEAGTSGERPATRS